MLKKDRFRVFSQGKGQRILSRDILDRRVGLCSGTPQDFDPTNSRERGFVDQRGELPLRLSPFSSSSLASSYYQASSIKLMAESGSWNEKRCRLPPQVYVVPDPMVPFWRTFEHLQRAQVIRGVLVTDGTSSPRVSVHLS